MANADTAGHAAAPQLGVAAIRTQTVGEHLDRRIAACRKQVEDACILKAKCETLGILNYPQGFINDLSGYF